MTRAARYPLLVALVAVAMALALLAMGRVPICACGTVKLWHGVVQSAENSQHLTDWYTLTHVVHGFLFYLGLRLAVPRHALATRVLAATVIEAVWEVIENTDWVIERYREATISLDYYGDSIINSLGDLGAMLVGFAVAARAPLWLTLSLGVGLELLLAAMIRDNLTINVLMLLWPLDAIRQWQSAA